MYPLHISKLDAMLSGAIHDAPPVPFTTTQAHMVMREHIDCRANYCGCKGAAFRMLVEQGRIVPDPDGEYC